MRRLGAMILSTCLITTSILIVPIKESSSTGLTFSLYSIDQDFNLISIDPLTGSSKVVGPIGYCVEDMSFGPDGLLYASADLTTLQLHGGADTLITINITTGEATIIGPIGFNDVDAIAFAPNGTLYGADYYNGTLIEINPSTGQASEIGLLKYPPPSPPDKLFIGGMDFSPNGTLYGTEVFNAYGPSTLVTIDVGNGTLTAIGPLGVDTVEGIAFAYNGTLYGVSAVGFGNCNGDLLTINPKTGEGTIVGSVGVDQIDGLAAFPSTAYPPTGIPVPDAGEDQIVNEGDVVQFNGSASSELLNVLHVSAWGYNELQMMIESTGYSDNVSVTQVRLSEFNTGNPNELSVFDAIVFGFGNGYEKNREPIGRTTELRDFVSKGGGIVWTHDTLELTWDYGSDLEEPAGVNFDANYTHYIGLNNPEVEIIMDHDIIHYPFDIGNVSDLISKTPYPPPWYHYDHTSQSNVTTADIVIQHNTTPESKNFYLTIHEYGRGRVALQEIGHTVVSEGGSFLGIPSIRECKILVNAIYWVGEGERISNMLSYSWDFDATADSDGDGNPTNDIDATGQTPTHAYGDDGIYEVILTVIDNDGLSNSNECLVTVNNLAPAIEPLKPIEIDEGSLFKISAIANDPGSDDLIFTWDFEDGPTITNTYYNDGAAPDPYPSPWGVIPFSAMDHVQHIYGDDGVYTVTLTVEDDDGGVTTHSTNITINNVAPTIVQFGPFSADEGTPLSFIATFTDQGSDDLTFTWEFEHGPTITKTYHNDGVAPDPYKSPWGEFPSTVSDTEGHNYGDDGVYLLTLTVTDDDGGSTTYLTNITISNVAPTIESLEVYMYANVSLRVAGEKYHSVDIYLYEEGTEIWSGKVTRNPGNPDQQMATITNIKLNMTKNYTAIVNYQPNDPRINGNVWGANPVWIIMTFEDGSTEKLHHTFNVRKSYWNDDHWNHIDPWEVEFASHLTGHKVKFEAVGTDFGSDDLTFQWSFGVTTTHYNDGFAPDPYPSPDGIFPFYIQDMAHCPYTGPGSHTLMLYDDDGGATYETIVLL